MSSEATLTDFVMRELVLMRSGEFILHPNASEGFKFALDHLFESGADAQAQIEALVVLGSVFESRYGAFEVADGIAELLASDDRTLHALGMFSEQRARSTKKSFEKLTDSEPVHVAPRYGAERPEGTIKVLSFLRPGGTPPKDQRSQ